MIIYGINTKRYKDWAAADPSATNNGGYQYAKEIESNILPSITSEATIVTVGLSLYETEEIPYGSIAVCHQNRDPIEAYAHFMKRGFVWVCSKHSTVDILRKYGQTAVYIPLSIDTAYVAQYKTKKTKDIAYVGNAWDFKKDYLASLPEHIDQLSGLPRDELLREMAKYKRVIAEGRCLMEAQVLGAKGEVPQYPDGKEAVFVEPLDNRDTIEYWKILFAEVDKLNAS